ncbi:MAG: hypothetical protein SGCHY_000709 [Lobulomycetales sp.]
MSDAVVRQEIRAILSQPDWDDGSVGPLLVRLAWHASGTYDKNTGTGGSNGATMRFKPESTDGANAGLEHARAFLEPIKKKHPSLSYADLWTLAGALSIEEMGGPTISWRPGRVDKTVVSDNPRSEEVPPNGRLPDASQGAQHLRDIFYRMGFDDREIVALSGAHSLGRCHADRSGFSGPWTHNPTRFSNQYFTLLCGITWKEKQWQGPRQFTNESGSLMMLPTDLALIHDPSFKKHVAAYAKDQKLFFKDFAAAFAKLLDLGVDRGKL